MSKIIDRTGKGSAITQAEFDANYSSLAGINESQTGTTYTVDINDQNRTIEISNASAVTVTLTAIATIAAALHTDDFRVIIKNIGAGTVTINRSSTDTFDDTTTSQTLTQYEFIELQTDSTSGIWNIIRRGHSQVDFNSASSGTVITSGDFATGTKTFSSVASSGTVEDSTIAHGLGTDDIDFGCKVLGSLDSGTCHVAIADVNDYQMTQMGSNVIYGAGIGSVTTPAAGNLTIKAHNQSAGTQDITIHWWARKR